MAPFERSPEEDQCIEEIRGSIRRMKRMLQELDWFDTINSSRDAEVIPIIKEKVIAAEKMLREA